MSDLMALFILQIFFEWMVALSGSMMLIFFLLTFMRFVMRMFNVEVRPAQTALVVREE